MAASAEMVAASVGVELGEAAGGVGRQGHVDVAGIPEIDVRVVTGDVGGGGDLVHEPACACSNEPATKLASMRPRRIRQSGRSWRRWNSDIASFSGTAAGYGSAAPP